MGIVDELRIFENAEFGKIRMIEVKGKPYAVGVDVARALEYANPSKALIDHCKGDFLTWKVTDALGREQETRIIPEGDIYRLIVKAADQSKNKEIKAKAEKFERWIFDEVIPQIRQTGGYIPIQEEDDEEMILARALIIAQKTIEKKTKIIEEQKRILKEQEPKVKFAEAVEGSPTSILIGDLAKILKQNGIDIGQKRLFEWLRNNGYLIKRKGLDYNMPTQRSMDLGLFEIKETVIQHNSGETTVSKTPRVTGKGQIYFINKFKNEISYRSFTSHKRL